MDGEPALRERREEERSQHHAEWMVSADEGNGDPEVAGAAGKPSS